MKHILILFFVFLSAAHTQSIQVQETRQVPIKSQGTSFFPSFSHDGQSILYTTAGYMGLWMYDLAAGVSKKLTAGAGAGYDPISVENGAIIFRQDEYVNYLKYSSFMSLDPETLEETQLTSPSRFVSTPSLSGSKLHFFQNGTFKMKQLVNSPSLNSDNSEISVLNDKLKIYLFRDGEVQVISPRGKGNYIWSELSPQKDKILFTKTGDGTYVCDLEGRILADLGHASASRWSPKGNFIVFMKEHDDGVQYTSSEIWISSADGKQTWQITDTPNRIEMYPQWSPDQSQIVYHTGRGEIYLTNILITD